VNSYIPNQSQPDRNDVDSSTNPERFPDAPNRVTIASTRSGPIRSLPVTGAYAICRRMHAGSLEALRVTRPEAVDLERIKREFSPKNPSLSETEPEQVDTVPERFAREIAEGQPTLDVNDSAARELACFLAIATRIRVAACRYLAAAIARLLGSRVCSSVKPRTVGSSVAEPG
jgi:hypothetical protein